MTDAVPSYATEAPPSPPPPTPPLAARVLGYAGLLPVVIAIGWRLRDPTGVAMPLVLGLLYAALILSFLGGMWWGAVAGRLHGARLTLWLAVAVLPSLVALGAGFAVFASVLTASVVLALALLASLLADLALTRAGHVPAWWMRLRVPLSVGLAVLTLVLGLLAPR